MMAWFLVKSGHEKTAELLDDTSGRPDYLTRLLSDHELNAGMHILALRKPASTSGGSGGATAAAAPASSSGGAGGAHGGAGRQSASLSSILEACSRRTLPSPSTTAAQSMLQPKLASIDWGQPPLPMTALPDFTSPLHSLMELVASHNSTLKDFHPLTLEGSILKEKPNYALARKFVPAWIDEAAGKAAAATKLFLARSAAEAPSVRSPSVSSNPSLCDYQLPWDARPELRLTMKVLQHPAFNGEVKSAVSAKDGNSPKLFDELVTYCTLAMAGSMFYDVPLDCRRYYREPPICYGLVGLAHVGYLVVCQWVGKVFVTVISQPFFLGSPEHQSAIAGLPDLDYAPLAVDINKHTLQVTMADDKAHRVLWTPAPVPDPLGGDGNCFIKIIQCDAYEAPYFRRLHTVYRKLRADAIPEPPSSIVSATLLYGIGEVAIVMPFRGNRDATDDDLQSSGVAVDAVADAIIWLASLGLLYFDLRLPNVRISSDDSRVFLVDYDDVLVVETRPSTFSAFKEALSEAGAKAFPDKAAEGTYLTPGRPRHMPAVAAAIERRWSRS